MGVRASGEASSLGARIPAELPTSSVSFAEIVARDFLAGRPTVMPVAEGVPQNLGFNQNDPTAMEGAALVFDRVFAGASGGTPLVLVRFRVTQQLTVDRAPVVRVYNLTVPLVRDLAGRDLLAGLPSLTPATFAASDSVVEPAPDPDTTFGFTENLPEPVKRQVTEWAKAFASDDRAQLKNLVGGGADAAAATGEYLGLAGFSLARDPVIPWAVVLDQTASRGYLRATLLVADSSANGYTASVSYDLLVLDWSTPTPRVVAWGPPGSGQTLVPYANNTALQ